MKVDGVAVAAGEFGDLRVGRVAQTLRPGPPVGAVLLGEHTPGGEVIECGALTGCEGRESLLASGRPWHVEHQPERFPLGGPGRVAIDGLGFTGLCGAGLLECAHAVAVGQGGEFRNGLNP